MKTCSTLLGALLLLLPSRVHSLPLYHDGAIVYKIDKTYLVVFPAHAARIESTPNPVGKITIDKNITILYALTIIGGKARFINVDASTLPQDILSKLRFNLTPARQNLHFGFMVKDSSEPELDLHISPTFMAGVENNVRALQRKMSRQGNLNVIVSQSESGVKILSVCLD